MLAGNGTLSSVPCLWASPRVALKGAAPGFIRQNGTQSQKKKRIQSVFIR